MSTHNMFLWRNNENYPQIPSLSVITVIANCFCFTSPTNTRYLKTTLPMKGSGYNFSNTISFHYSDMFLVLW